MKQLTYRILLNREPKGGYTVTEPTLPGCITYGETIDEAITMAKEAIELYIESLVAHDEPIPDDPIHLNIHSPLQLKHEQSPALTPNELARILKPL